MSKATITVEGFVTKDPETRQAGGKAVVSVDIAHTPRKKDGDKWVDVGETIWFQASFWERDAAPVAAAIVKGTLVTVTGSPDLNLYQKQDGTTAVTIRIKGATIGVIPREANNSQQTTGQGQQGWATTPAAQSYTAQGADTWGGVSDDTPF